MKLNSKEIADLYFLDNQNKREDISFYLEYAKKIGGDILELGCGTGRVSIPLAEHGFNVTAVDSSQSMLNVFKKKAKNLINRKNLKIIKADFTNLNLGKKFDLIIMPFRVFQCLLSVEEQHKALLNINRHLDAKGFFIFDVYCPELQILSNIPSREKIDNKFTFKNKQIIKSHINKKIDALNQIISADIIYYEYSQKKNKIIAKKTIKTRYFFRFEIEHLLKLNSFVVEKFLNDFKFKKNKNSKEMVFICVKEMPSGNKIP